MAYPALPALMNSDSASLYRFSSSSLKACFKCTSLILCLACWLANLNASSNYPRSDKYSITASTKFILRSIFIPCYGPKVYAHRFAN